jgi:hypothetical protein
MRCDAILDAIIPNAKIVAKTIITLVKFNRTGEGSSGGNSTKSK